MLYMKKMIFSVMLVVLCIIAATAATDGRVIRQSLPAIELTDRTVNAVLNDSIVPIAVGSGYDRCCGQIVLKIYCTDKWYSVWPVKYYIEIEAVDSRPVSISELKEDKRYEAANFYGMEVGGVPILVVDMTDGMATRPVKDTITIYYYPVCKVNDRKSNCYRYAVGDRETYLDSYSIGGTRYLKGYMPIYKELD